MKNCTICNSPLILFGSRYKCPSCNKMKIDNSDLLMAIDLLRYILTNIHTQEVALQYLQTGHVLSINGQKIDHPAQLVLKRAVYKVKLTKHDQVVLQQKVYFNRETSCLQESRRTNIQVK